MKKFFIILILSISVLSAGNYVKAYQIKADTLENVDLIKNEKEKNRRFLALPIITFAPETSLQLGAIGVYLFRFKNSPPKTRLSAIKFPISYTLENQVKVRLSYEIFFRDNDHIIKGYNQWIRFPLLFYGIGAETKNEDEEIYTTSTWNFNFSYLKKVREDIYTGFRINYNNSNIIEFEEKGLLSEQSLVPGGSGSRTSGIGIIGRIDKRDNNFNATNGPFIEGSVTTHRDAFGSNYDFTTLELDFRNYWEVFDHHVIAVQTVFEHNWGDPPFEYMALLGGDEIMRGHYEGRFRDKAMWAAQVEYRLPLGRVEWIDEREKIPFWQRWGLVGFAGLGNVSEDLTNSSFDELKSAVGVGLRFLALPKERVNIRVDVGIGTEKPGFYFNVREAF